MKDLQLLTTVSSDFEAEIVRQKLAEAGIESLLQSGSLGNMYPAIDAASGIGIFVKPEEFEKATWLVTNAKDELADDAETGVGD